MRDLNRKVFATVFFFHLAFLIIFLFYTLFLDMKGLLPEVSLQWIFGKALSLWIQYLVPITLAAVVIAYSLVITAQDLRGKTLGGGGFVAVAGASVRIFLIFTVLYVIIIAFLQGPVQSLYLIAESKSARVREYKNLADLAIQKGDLTTANRAYTLALKISPSNSNLNALKNDLLARMSGSAYASSAQNLEKDQNLKSRSEQSNSSLGIGEKKNIAFRDLILRVEDYLEKEDYFSALYYLELAKKLSPSGDSELILLETKAKRGIRGEDLSASDEQKKKIYQLKQEAILELKETGRAELAYFLLLEVD